MTDLRPDTRSTAAQDEARQSLLRLFEETPLSPEELLVNLHLYMRSTIVAKLLYLNELYEQIVHLPGAIFEFGVWRGANLAAFESLRAVHEPYNVTRRVVGFDTFSGYPKPGACDGIIERGMYDVGEGYVDHLRQLLDYHQVENVSGHIKKYELVEGDASEMVVTYLGGHPETVIALAYFDMALYEPTRDCLRAILPHLLSGSVLAFDELNSGEFPGETVAVREILDLTKHDVRRSRFLPDRTMVTIR